MFRKTYLRLGDWNAICACCNIEKPLTDFYLHSNVKPRKRCKECHKNKSKEWGIQNKDKRNISASKSRQANPEKHREAIRKWRKSNLQYDAFRAATYRARKQNQTPSWADLNEIEKIYLNCPKGYHVDHIVPLKGKEVSGLHVEYNLQYLPALDNIKKRNKHLA